MRKATSLLTNRDFIFSLAIALGLGLGHPARWIQGSVLPVLAVIMTVSTLGIPENIFKNPRALIPPVMTGILMSFLLQGGVLLGLGKLLLKDPMLWTGTVLVAAVPPAIAIIPFTGLLHGDIHFSIIATVGGYLTGLVITPLLCLIILGAAVIHPLKILLILSELILAPILLSRILHAKGYDQLILPYKGPITNWGFFIVVYTIIGLNRSVFFNTPSFILPLLLISFSSTFLLGGLIALFCRLLRVERTRRISLNLLGTMKNAGTAAGIGLVLFGKTAALPAALVTLFMIVYFVFLGLVQQWQAQPPLSP